MDDLLRTAIRSAEAASAVHRRYSGRVDVAGAEEKGAKDFVSRVDVEAQQAALAVIRERFPDHRVLAEEDEETPSASGDARVPLWIVDPLDGTTNFLHGHPMYSASVGVFSDGRPRAGAVISPPTGERWWAAAGGGAFKDGRAIRVSRLQRLSHALIGTGFPFKALDRLPDYLDQLGRVLRSASGVRRGGSAALDLCYLADGRFDAFWEAHLAPWDIAAGWLIVEEAGGTVTRRDGSRPDLAAGSILAANSPALHRALSDVLDGA